MLNEKLLEFELEGLLKEDKRIRATAIGEQLECQKGTGNISGKSVRQSLQGFQLSCPATSPDRQQ